jgi:TolB-like protein/class 3 adenylate cyclase/Tfp pilus assembly protein PilF
VERRLAAILAADVAGYTRLMEIDEDATIAAWRKARGEVIDPAIAEFHGRIVKHTGDGFLAEFASVLDAVTCAVEIQNNLNGRNRDVPKDARMAFRMGINVSDIAVDDDDIHGDGVNIAARLESIADPGGIAVSGDVYNQVHKRLDVEFESLGEQNVKHIAEPIPVYRIVLDGVEARKLPKQPKTAGQSIYTVAAIVAVAMVATSVWWWRPWAPIQAQASLERMAFPLPKKPSLAVLPFDNFGDDGGKINIADGLTEDLITGLSQVSSLFVIARNSTFAYRGKPAKIQQVAEELGVRYVLEGSVQRSDDKVRITAQLIDAISGHHMWAERYDRDVADLFALQDEITNQIVTALRVQLTEGEETQVHRRHTRDLDAWNLYNRGLEKFYRFSRIENIEARELFKQAIETDRAYALAYALVAWTHWIDVVNRWVDRPDLALEEAEFLTEKALALDETLPDLYALRGVLKLNHGEFDEARRLARQAVALNPNHATNNALLGFVLQVTGDPEAGILQFKTAMRLSPYYPSWYLENLGYCYLMSEHYEEAAEAFKNFLDRSPAPERRAYVNLSAAMALVSLGREGEARQHVEAALEIVPSLTVKNWTERSLTKDRRWVDKGAGQLARLGLPE